MERLSSTRPGSASSPRSRTTAQDAHQRNLLRHNGLLIRQLDAFVRPEQADLFLRLGVDQLPGPRTPVTGTTYLTPSIDAGSPVATYSVAFDVNDERFEVRGKPLGADGRFESVLHRCDPDCAAVTVVPGQIGTTGDEVVFSVPLARLDLEDASFGNLTARAELHVGAALLSNTTGEDWTRAFLTAPVANLVEVGSNSYRVIDRAGFDRGAFTLTIPPGEVDASLQLCTLSSCSIHPL